MAHGLVQTLEEHQASDIVLLDLSEVSSFTDYFLICTVDSDRQAKALQEIVISDMKQNHALRPLSTEGDPASGWVLVDYNTVILHIFSREARAFYQLEEFWKNAPAILKIQ